MIIQICSIIGCSAIGSACGFRWHQSCITKIVSDQRHEAGINVCIVCASNTDAIFSVFCYLIDISDFDCLEVSTLFREDITVADFCTDYREHIDFVTCVFDTRGIHCFTIVVNILE